MKLFTRIAVAALATFLISTAVEARQHHKSRHLAAQKWQASGLIDVAAIAPYPMAQTHQNRVISSPMGKRHIAPSNGYSMAEGVIGGRSSECVKYHRGRLIPNCGCEAAKEVGLPNGGPGKIGNWDLAANWRQLPSASCAPNMAAWRYGHVFIIKQCNGDGTVLAFDGNSGNGLTRLHNVSLRGYHIVDPSRYRMASR